MTGIEITKIDENAMRFSFTNGSLTVLIRNGDITKESCDAIVNSTSTSMVPTGGLDTYMHETMGRFFTDQVVAIHKDTKENSCPVGQSRIFIGKFIRNEHDARFIISTVGPIYSEDEQDRSTFLLQSCYYTSLALANIYQLSSIAYPAISCGANHFPQDKAARVAIEAIRQFAYSVKDVRFVLHQRSTYDTFVRAWTDYARKVNRDVNSSGETGHSDLETSKTIVQPTPTPLKSKSSPQTIRLCVLCMSMALTTDQSSLCNNCSTLTRASFFKTILSKLRAAGDESYEALVKACELVKPILNIYSLVYTPAQRFDPSAHQPDKVADYYVQNHCDKRFRSYVTISVVGDGNCLYNAFIKLAGINSLLDETNLTPTELRARNIVELVLNVDSYRSQYSHIMQIFDPFEKYVTKEMVRDTNYASVWDICSIATVLNVHVITVYPKMNTVDDLNHRYLDKGMFIPICDENTADNQEKLANDPSASREVIILFSNCNRIVTGIKSNNIGWRPNHFVPLLPLK